MGKHRCFANRGANGIDGNLSSFLGLVACDEDEAWAVVGDLTALYDLAACFILPQIAFRGRLRIVVINNGGGKIFSRLPALDLTKDDRVAAMIENPHTADFEGFARLWGLAYRRIEAVAELADPGDKGVELWDVVVPQTTTQGKDSRRNGGVMLPAALALHGALGGPEDWSAVGRKMRVEAVDLFGDEEDERELRATRNLVSAGEFISSKWGGERRVLAGYSMVCSSRPARSAC